MRDATFYASSLLELHDLDSVSERRAAWRQSIAGLARAASEDGPGPLEGLRPEALVDGVRAALEDGLVDDLEWLDPGAAGVALYELASVLPVGPEQRELGRRVIARVMAADAPTFVAIARRMALGAGKGLAGRGMRARVVLVTELPLALGVADGPLALAIASRRDAAREWIADASTGSLVSRRLAARLIERAAREAARRASYGDDHSLRVFKSDAVAPAWSRLLADRESLVWRHIAVARGLLAPWVPQLVQAMDQSVAPSLTPTEWRRGAASIAAYTAVAPDAALALAKRAVAQGLLTRDPGAAAAFVWGLPRAAEAEKEAADALLDLVFDHATPEIGEAVVELRLELGDTPLADRAAKRALALLGQRGKGAGDDGAEALAQEVIRDLERWQRADEPLRDQIERALLAFASAGAKGAYGLAQQALAAAEGSLSALEAVTPQEDGIEGRPGSIARRTSLAVLRDLDVSLLERDVLTHLLVLGGGGDVERAAQGALDPLHDRMAEWILARESTPLVGVAVGSPDHPVLSLRRLRALLHVVDSDIGDVEEDPQRSARLRKRWLRMARALVGRFERDPPSPVRRTIVAALARALDALVRVGACDVVDALLVVAHRVADPTVLATMAEASMDPDLVHVLGCYAVFAQAVEGDAAGALPAFEVLTRDISPETSGRIESLRTAFVRVAAALAALSSAATLRDLAPRSGGEPEAVASLETALSAISHLSASATAKLDPDRSDSVPPPAVPRSLSIAVAHALNGADDALGEDVVQAALDDLSSGVPRALADLVAAQVTRVAELPVEGAKPAARPSMRVAEALPAWLPPRRSLGGFYVLRALGAGGVGSVFVATRLEDKGDDAAEKLALKVPEYSASSARAVSEGEFMKMFREEASALIALPQHPNLARFVTFDAGSKPKPILVMELVEGVTLERLLETRGLGARRAVRVLGDVLAGLEAMHGAGIAHLDVKPSNVVLRGGEEGVLVDFGLAGKHLRPGCATSSYGAPEVWRPGPGEPDPSKADIYAFGCVAFEALTGRLLFEADSEMSQVSLHLAHDGFPPALKALMKRAALVPLAELLFSTLRRDPAARLAAVEVRKELAKLVPQLARLPWPIDAG